MDEGHTSEAAVRRAEALSANSVEALPEGGLARQLDRGEPLRIKLGIDPTAPDIHLGHTVVLNKLRQFQDDGHQVVLIIGDYTARVGDPTGRSEQRPMLDPRRSTGTPRTFQEQAFKILDPDRTEVRFNSEWLRMEPEELLGLLAKATIARLLERDDFQKRMAAEEPISALELLYPLLQGYDSVAIDADVELGGTDQKFNLLFGRAIQSAYGKPPADGDDDADPARDRRRAADAKSTGNYIGVTDAPEEMFGKVMSDPRRGDGRVLAPAARRSEPPDGAAEPGEARAGRPARGPLPRRGRGDGGRGALRPRLRAARGAGGDRGASPIAATTAGPPAGRCWPTPSGSAGARPAGCSPRAGSR